MVPTGRTGCDDAVAGLVALFGATTRKGQLTLGLPGKTPVKSVGFFVAKNITGAPDLRDGETLGADHTACGSAPSTGVARKAAPCTEGRASPRRRRARLCLAP